MLEDRCYALVQAVGTVGGGLKLSLPPYSLVPERGRIGGRRLDHHLPPLVLHLHGGGASAPIHLPLLPDRGTPHRCRLGHLGKPLPRGAQNPNVPPATVGGVPLAWARPRVLQFLFWPINDFPFKPWMVSDQIRPAAETHKLKNLTDQIRPTPRPVVATA